MDPTERDWDIMRATETNEPGSRDDQLPDFRGPAVPCTPCVTRFLEEFSCWLKKNKNTQPKNSELYFIWWTFWGPQGWEAASQIALRDYSEVVREKLGYTGVLQQRPGSQNIKRSLLTKENQTSQVNELSTFLYMGKWKRGLTESIAWYAP